MLYTTVLCCLNLVMSSEMFDGAWAAWLYLNVDSVYCEVLVLFGLRVKALFFFFFFFNINNAFPPVRYDVLWSEDLKA